MPTLREQILLDQAAMLGNTSEFAEPLEFAGEQINGIIGTQGFRLPGGAGWAALAEGKTVLHVMRADLDTVPDIGDRTTLNDESVLVIDRKEPVAGALTYVLQ